MNKSKKAFKISLLLISAVLLFINCGREKDSKEQQIKAESSPVEWTTVGASKGTIKDTVFLENLKVVPLETTIASIVIQVSKVFLDEDRIFIFDRSQDKVLSFNSKGKYINQIDKEGRGPNEYRAILDAFVDTENNEIHIMSDSPHRIMTFDYEMNYIGESKVNELYLEFVEEEDYFISRRAETGNYIPNTFYVDIVEESTGRVLDSLLPVNASSEHLNRTRIEGSMLTKTASTLFTTLGDEHIYEIDKNNIDKKYSFELDKEHRKDENPVQMVDMIETKHFLMFRTFKGIYLYNMEKDKLNLFPYGILNLSINIGLSQYRPINNSSEQVVFIGLPSMYKMVEETFRKDTVGVNEKFLNFASKLEEGDNPVLFFYDFKGG